MKAKAIIAFFFTIALLTFAACSNNNSVLQNETGATSKQADLINEWLDAADIMYQTVETSSNSLTKDMDEAWMAYDLTNENGDTYLLILRKEDHDFTAVFNSDGDLLAGLIDNTVLPAYYAD